MMCCVWCFKEFKGWCRSFTRTERALTVIEAALLVVLIVFLVFLILHLLTCSSSDYAAPEQENPDIGKLDYGEVEKPITQPVPTTIPHKTDASATTEGYKTTEATIPTQSIETTTAKHKTIDPNVECSWTPSAKTTSVTRYFEQGAKAEPLFDVSITKRTTTTKPRKLYTYSTSGYDVDFIEEDQSDGEDADPAQNEYVMSLVRPQPPRGAVFGCILTIIHESFTLTSASCIEAVEEVDSLDSFVIMEGYGTSSDGRSWSVSDVQIHPFYRGVDRSYDLALVRSEGRLRGRALALPAPLDVALLTIGERLHVLGFGPYRSRDVGLGRRLRRAAVYRLPRQQCAGWSLRHLEAGRAVVGEAGPGAQALCAGVLSARGLPCHYCGGAPLLAGARLLAVMSDNPGCGAACEPQLYVDVAACRDWIDSVLDG